MDSQESSVIELGSELRKAIRKFYNIFFLDYLFLVVLITVTYPGSAKEDNLYVAAIFIVAFALIKLSVSHDAKVLISEGDLDSIKKEIIEYNADRKERYRGIITGNSFWFAAFTLASIGYEYGLLVGAVYVVFVITIGICLQRFLNKRLEDFTEEEKKYIEEQNKEKENNK